MDLNTLYDMVDSPAVITETSQANCNQPSNDAVNGISSIYLNQTSDNAEDTGLSGLELYRCGNEGIDSVFFPWSFYSCFLSAQCSE